MTQEEEMTQLIVASEFWCVFASFVDKWIPKLLKFSR